MENYGVNSVALFAGKLLNSGKCQHTLITGRCRTGFNSKCIKKSDMSIYPTRSLHCEKHQTILCNRRTYTYQWICMICIHDTFDKLSSHLMESVFYISSCNWNKWSLFAFLHYLWKWIFFLSVAVWKGLVISLSGKLCWCRRMTVAVFSFPISRRPLDPKTRRALSDAFACVTGITFFVQQRWQANISSHCWSPVTPTNLIESL